MTATALIGNGSQVKADGSSAFNRKPRAGQEEIGVRARSRTAARNGSIRGNALAIDGTRLNLPSVRTWTDQDVTIAVRNILKWDLAAPENQISATVSHGTVTLQGSVDTWMQRYYAERAIRGLPGVKAVINQIIVKAAPPDTRQSRYKQTAVEPAAAYAAAGGSVGDRTTLHPYP